MSKKVMIGMVALLALGFVVQDSGAEDTSAPRRGLMNFCPLGAEECAEAPGPGNPARERVRQMQQRFVEELQLNEEQQAQAKEIRDARLENFRAIRADETLSAEEKRAKAKEVLQAAQKDIAKILTPEQLEKAKVLRDNAKRRFHERRSARQGDRLGQRRGDGPGNKDRDGKGNRPAGERAPRERKSRRQMQENSVE